MEEQIFKDSEIGNNYFQAKIIEIDKLIQHNQNLRKNIEQLIPILQENLKKVQEKVEILQKDIYRYKSVKYRNYNFIFCNIKNPLLTYFLNSYKTYCPLTMDFIDDEDQMEDFSDMDFEDFSQDSESDEFAMNLNYDIKVALLDDQEKQTLEKKKFNYYADIFAKDDKKRNSTKKKKTDPKTLIAEVKKEDYEIRYYKKQRKYVNILQQKQQMKKEEKLKNKQIEQFLKLNWEEILNQEILQKFKQTKNLRDIDYVELSDYLFKKQKQNLFNTKIPGVQIYKFVKKQIQYKTNKIWTSEKQKKLMDLYKVTNEQNVSQVSLYFEEFSTRDCVKQFSRLSCSSIKWRPDQDFKLIFGVIAYKASWSRICAVIFKNEKNQMQCRERFANVLNPQIVYKKLDKQSMIEVLYRSCYGQTWAQIEKLRFSNTTDNQLLRSAKKFQNHNPQIYQFMTKLVEKQQSKGLSLDFDRDKDEIQDFLNKLKEKEEQAKNKKSTSQECNNKFRKYSQKTEKSKSKQFNSIY